MLLGLAILASPFKSSLVYLEFFTLLRIDVMERLLKELLFDTIHFRHGCRAEVKRQDVCSYQIKALSTAC